MREGDAKRAPRGNEAGSDLPENGSKPVPRGSVAGPVLWENDAGWEQAHVSFRRMEEGDVGQAAGIERQLFSQPWTEQAFLDAMSQDTLFLSAVSGDELVGYCGMYCSFGEGEITNVAVAPAWQGRGIGRRMLGCLLAMARWEGIARVVLEARASNRRAIGLYESLGFRACGIRKGFYEFPREDGIVMERSLLPSA